MELQREKSRLKKLISFTHSIGFVLSKNKKTRDSSDLDPHNLIQNIKKSVLKEAVTDETGIILRGATFEVLTEWIVLSCHEESHDLKAFLLTYRLFQTPKQLTIILKKIHSNYASKTNSPSTDHKDIILSNLSIFLREWSDNWPHDLEAGVFAQILDLAEQVFPPNARNIFKLKFLKAASRKKGTIGLNQMKKANIININDNTTTTKNFNNLNTGGTPPIQASVSSSFVHHQSHNNNNNHFLNISHSTQTPSSPNSFVSNQLRHTDPVALRRSFFAKNELTNGIQNNSSSNINKNRAREAGSTFSLQQPVPSSADLADNPQPNKAARFEPPIGGSSLTSPREKLVDGRCRELTCLVSAMKSSEIAQALNAVDLELVRDLQPTEFLEQAWQAPDRETLAPCLTHLAERFNLISMWISTQILINNDRKNQIRLLSKFVRAAKYLFDMNNFQTMMQIISGINNISVQRLKLEEWLPNKQKEYVERLTNLMSPANNFRNYRAAIKQLPTYFPHMVVVLRDVTHINDGNPSYFEEQVINFEKLQLLSSIIYNTTSTIKSFTAYSSSVGFQHSSLNLPLAPPSPGGLSYQTAGLISSASLPPNQMLRRNHLCEAEQTEYEDPEELQGSTSSHDLKNSLLTTRVLNEDALYALSLSFVPPPQSSVSNMLLPTEESIMLPVESAQNI